VYKKHSSVQSIFRAFLGCREKLTKHDFELVVEVSGNIFGFCFMWLEEMGNQYKTRSRYIKHAKIKRHGNINGSDSYSIHLLLDIINPS
jgi:hypothetical protein